MKSILQTLICSYIFFVSWTDAYSLAPNLPISILILLVIIGIYFASIVGKRKISHHIYKTEDLFVIACLIGVCLSGIANWNEKTLSYILAYFCVLILGYLVLKGIAYKNASYYALLKINTIAVIFISFFTASEFLIELLTNFDIQTLIPRENVARATYLGQFSRSYGLAHEPTILAFYLNTLTPIALWTLWKGKSICKFTVTISNLIKSSIPLLVVFAWLTTFSAAMVFLPIGFLITTLLICSHNYSINLSRKYIAKIILTLLVIILLSTTIVLDISKHNLL